MDIDTLGSSFGSFLPLPFRILSLAGTGLVCWASNLHFLSLLGIDTSYVLDIQSHFHANNAQSSSYIPLSTPPSPRPSSSSSRIPGSSSPSNAFSSYPNPALLYPPVYRLFVACTLWTFTGWTLFRFATGGDRKQMDEHKTMPILFSLVPLFVLICPLNILQKPARMVFLRATWRCLTSPTTQPIHFADIILADIFTSFAKVLGDVWLSTCILLGSNSFTAPFAINGFSEFAVPFLMSLPYLIRFRQCSVEYLGSNRQSYRPLYNAVKYATAFPVIILSAAQRPVTTNVPKDTVEEAPFWSGRGLAFHFWLFAVFVNSLYSFWWDITNDWGLDILRPSSSSSSSAYQPLPQRSRPSSRIGKLISAGTTLAGSRPASPSPPSSPVFHTRSRSNSNPTASYPYGLRSALLFHDPTVYYLAILVNFILRFTWSLKLSTHLHIISELESGVFMMEMLEVVRRWVWVFFRVEWEVIRKGLVEFGVEGASAVRPDAGAPRGLATSSRHTVGGDVELLSLHHHENGGAEFTDAFAQRHNDRLRPDTSSILR